MSSLSCETVTLCKFCFFFQAEDGIRDGHVTGVQTCALPISGASTARDRLPSLIYPKNAKGGDLSLSTLLALLAGLLAVLRSEERRVGKEGGCRRPAWRPQRSRRNVQPSHRCNRQRGHWRRRT